MKLSRRENRINAMKLLYTIDFNNCSLNEAVQMVFEEEMDSDAVEFASNVIIKLDEIDKAISDSLTGYTIERLNNVDKAIIRLATSELMNKTTPSNIVINEALEITKQYADLGDRKAVAFNNRLLDKINTSLNM